MVHGVRGARGGDVTPRVWVAAGRCGFEDDEYVIDLCACGHACTCEWDECCRCRRFEYWCVVCEVSEAWDGHARKGEAT